MSKEFYNVGISYKKADVRTRGSFSISKENQEVLLNKAKKQGIRGIMVISTCNRTEITGFVSNPYELIELLCEFSKGSIEEFIKFSYIYKEEQAIDYLFRIGTGLESQILGDYQIVGQIKKSFQLSKEIGTTNAYIERLMNFILQASKNVKNKTHISSGTTSVSYAAVQYLAENVPNYQNKRILVYGLGDIGKNTCRNLIKYIRVSDFHLINRTNLNLKQIIGIDTKINVHPYKDLALEIQKSDILIVSTGSQTPTVKKEDIMPNKQLCILDLSVPGNVDIGVKSLEGVTLVNVDELSEITNNTIEIRKKQIPHVKDIIETYKYEFLNWLEHRKLSPSINALKKSLKSIKNDEIDIHKKKFKDFNVLHAEEITERLIQKITTQFVKHLKDEQTSISQSIKVINKVFDLENIIDSEKNN